jgi:phage shock protein A
MSEERFDRIDQEIAGLKTDVAELKTDVAGLKTDVAGLKTDVAGLKTDFGDLRQHMHVLHEDMMANFAKASERDVVTRSEFHATLAERDERVNRRLDPLELAVRAHSADIAKLKRTRG